MESSLLVKYNLKFKEILHSLILEHIKESPNVSLLDIGCGWGKDIQSLCELQGKNSFLGIDISFDKINYLSNITEKKQKFYVLQARGEELPFKSDIFDIVVSSEVIEHIDDVRQYLHDVSRVLKEKGVFLITTPSRYNYVTLIGKIIPHRFKNKLRRLVYSVNPCEDTKPHVHEFTPTELKKLFEKNGFLVKRIIGGALRVPFWSLFERYPVLVLMWKFLGRVVNALPWGIHLKQNFILEGIKISRE